MDSRLRGNDTYPAGAVTIVIPSKLFECTGIPVLPTGVRFDNEVALVAFGRIWRELIVRMPGEAWKLTGPVVEELRQRRYPGLLRGEV